VILDEINVALHYGLIKLADIIELLENRPPDIEIVLTGRYAPKEIIKKADLVTEFKKIKHYIDKGVRARVGIEA
jgi:cob(I)alamin adenosyltransferase